jgi:SAM-dependent methyltransferase
MTGASFIAGFQTLDFDALYRGECPAEGLSPVATPPWDTNAPKENVIAWQEGGWIRGEILDIGCGLGDNAIYLAKCGHNVTGLDISPTALIIAQRRAEEARVTVKFAVTDSTTLEGYIQTFDTIVDSGMFHCLNVEGKRSYAAAAHRATRPRAILLLSCFSDAKPPDEDSISQLAPRWPRPAVSEQTLRDVLGGASWEIESLEPAIESRKLNGKEVEMAAFWHVRARRR